MAMEIWLRTNARALAFGMVPPAIVGLIGAVLVAGIGAGEPPPWLRAIGAVLAGLGLVTIAALAWQLRTPRLAYGDGRLRVWLRSGGPIVLPIDVVEGFLLGQAPSLLPGKRHRTRETATLVIRIADSAPEWHRQEVKPQLGKWCEGYVTIRGTWCEPLSVALVSRLNERLAEVSRKRRETGGGRLEVR
jgi:hypothetical protein